MGVGVFRFEMGDPEDIRHLSAILRQVSASETERVAVLGKTEGTATINDFGRALALRAIRDALVDAGFRSEPHIILSMGSEGIVSPGGYLFLDTPRQSTGIPGLALGLASSRPLGPSDMMTKQHVEVARATTHRAIRDAGISVHDVALVLCKNPLLTRDAAVGLSAEQMSFAGKSWASRGVAALGIGIALGEIAAEHADPKTVLGLRQDIFSRRAMVFSGTETDRIEVIVLGNKPGRPSAVCSGHIQDIIDIDGLANIVTEGGINAVRDLVKSGRIVASILKANVAPDGKVRGNRTTVYSSDLDPDKHMRAAASGVLGALLGDTRFFVSGGAEHQAPPGGGIFAIIQK